MIGAVAIPGTDAGGVAPADVVAPWSTTRATSADVDEQAASLKAWKQVYEQMTPGPFVGSLHEVSWGGTQVFRETTSQAVHECGGPQRGRRAFGVPMGSARAALFRGEPVDLDTLVTLDGGDELDFYTPRGFDILGLVVDADALDAHARDVEHRDLGAVLDGTGTTKPAPERLAELRELLLSVLQSQDANPAALQHRQTQRVLQQSLFAAIVAAIPGDGASAALPCPGRRHVVDAAKALMQSRIAETITIADVCVALGVSRRTLQYSFQEVLGINPVRFLRALRLNGVRRDLRGDAAPSPSVQDTAAKWGFWHLGHFVNDYKQMFGELPSETVRRSGRRPRATLR